jgi:hypothetical protein
MDNLARQQDDLIVFHEFGQVAEVRQGGFVVDTPSGRYTAKKAVSCLLEPGKGARVLIAGDPLGDCYILSVLEYGAEKKCSIQFDGDVEMVAKNGQFQLAAQKGIHLTTVEQIGMISSDLKVHSQRAEVSISQLVYLGTSIFAQLSKIKVLATTVESTIRRLTQKVFRSYRTVEDIDQVKAGKIDYNAEKTMSLHGKYSLLTAKNDVKIDGKMIHMG